MIADPLELLPILRYRNDCIKIWLIQAAIDRSCNDGSSARRKTVTELFAGSTSLGTVARQQGLNYVAVDWSSLSLNSFKKLHSSDECTDLMRDYFNIDANGVAVACWIGTTPHSSLDHLHIWWNGSHGEACFTFHPVRFIYSRPMQLWTCRVLRLLYLLRMHMEVLVGLGSSSIWSERKWCFLAPDDDVCTVLMSYWA